MEIPPRLVLLAVHKFGQRVWGHLEIPNIYCENSFGIGKNLATCDSGHEDKIVIAQWWQ